MQAEPAAWWLDEETAHWMRMSMQLDGDIWLTVDASQPRRLTCQQESKFQMFPSFFIVFQTFSTAVYLKSSETCARHEPVRVDLTKSCSVQRLRG